MGKNHLGTIQILEIKVLVIDIDKSDSSWYCYWKHTICKHKANHLMYSISLSPQTIYCPSSILPVCTTTPIVLPREWLTTLVFLPGESMDRWSWMVTVHGVAKSQTQLSDFCFQVQALSARPKRGQWIRETMSWVKEETSFGELTDWEDDGRRTPQNNHLLRVWMPGSFTDQRWGAGEVRKQRPLILQTSPRMASLRQGMC